MKNKPKLLSLVVATTPLLSALFGVFLGATLAPRLYFVIPEFWKHYEISPFPGAKKIISVDTRFANEPDGEVLYIVSEDDIVFSNSLFEDEWQIDTPTSAHEYIMPSCPAEWSIPIKKSNVIDSAGVSMTDAETTSVSRCYILFDDGSMEVWTDTNSIYDITISLIVGGVFGYIVGAIIGLIISVLIWRKN